MNKILLKNKSFIKLANQAIGLLSRSQRRTIKFFLSIQILASAIDLIAIGLMGLIASVTINTLSSKTQNPIVNKLLGFIGLSNAEPQKQVLIIGLVLVVLLLARTIFSVAITRRAYLLLSKVAAEKSGKGLEQVLSPGNFKEIIQKDQALVFGLSEGMDALFVGILGGCITLIGDLSVVIIVSLGLFILDFYVAIGSVLYFGIVFILLSRVLGSRAHSLGAKTSEKSIESNRFLLGTFRIFPEVYLRGTKSNYISKFEGIRRSRGDAIAEMAFLPFISKYVFETSIVLGTFLLSAFQFTRYSGSHAIGTLAVFLSASFRFAPALLRIQQILASFKWNTSAGSRALEILDQFAVVKNSEAVNPKISNRNMEISALEIKIENLEFRYEHASSGIHVKELVIESGHVYAFVGPSGAGKTTLANLILGFLSPETGTIKYNELGIDDLIKETAGLVAFVPQVVQLVEGSLRDNLLLELNSSDYSDELLLECLRISGLYDFYDDLPNGLSTELSNYGSILSGGQRQRLALARALVTKPKLLILDEATSNLDAQTENNITENLLVLKGDVTVIMIAHRLSTVKKADKIVYLDSGKVIFSGTFDQVRKAVPNFDHQAQLMGL